MIGYICKYTPVEIIQAFDIKPNKLEPAVLNFDNADTLMHSTMCSYTKAVIEQCINEKIDKIVLVNCCDSIRRLYDILKNDKTIQYVYLIDLPRKSNTCSQKLFYNEIVKFIKSLETLTNKNFNIEKLKEIINKNNLYTESQNIKNDSLDIAFIGARCKQDLINLIQKYNVNIKYNTTCTQNHINYTFNNNNILEEYCKQLLTQYPCMRMIETQNRHDMILQDKQLDGIIYHTIKFCDYYGYDFADIKSKCELPILKIETDYTLNSEGQLKTRIEAFIESIKNKKTTNSSLNKFKSTNINLQKNNRCITAGIDVGSTSANVVIINQNKETLSSSIVKTGAKSIEGANKALDEALTKANIIINDLDYIVSTGYGRISVPFANEEITEITCHGRGAHYINPDVRTIIDIGGQDSKSIKLDDKGNVKEFAMNDKCAAGTGRFLDMMAKTLEIDLSQMGKVSLKWKNDIVISSMCTVFAESEVVSLIAKNTEKSDIIHGLCNSIASKTITLVNRIGKEQQYMMTGGVAKNIGVVKCLENKLKSSIIIPQEPQIVGALGAALIALDKISSSK